MLWLTIQLHDWVWPDLCSILNALLCLWDEDVNIGLLRWRICPTMLLEFQMLNTWTSLPARKAGTMLSQVDSLPNLRHDFIISSALDLQRKNFNSISLLFPHRASLLTCFYLKWQKLNPYIKQLKISGEAKWVNRLLNSKNYFLAGAEAATVL